MRGSRPGRTQGPDHRPPGRHRQRRAACPDLGYRGGDRRTPLSACLRSSRAGHRHRQRRPGALDRAASLPGLPRRKSAGVARTHPRGRHRRSRRRRLPHRGQARRAPGGKDPYAGGERRRMRALHQRRRPAHARARHAGAGRHRYPGADPVPRRGAGRHRGRQTGSHRRPRRRPR
ncbi:Uncharacterised protein [Acinetobacter baumannii]|nr:Uncharacterised protein [Acinetobacter baumannii]